MNENSLLVMQGVFHYGRLKLVWLLILTLYLVIVNIRRLFGPVYTNDAQAHKDVFVWRNPV